MKHFLLSAKTVARRIYLLGRKYRKGILQAKEGQLSIPSRTISKDSPTGDTPIRREESNLTLINETLFEMVDEYTKFDPVWYSKAYGTTLEEAADHYTRYGLANLLAPNSSFSPLKYWEKAPDVAHKKVDPIDHYRKHGFREHRGFEAPILSEEQTRFFCSPEALERVRNFFGCDIDFIREQRQDLPLSLSDAKILEHYQIYGEEEGTRPSPFFDPIFYKSRYSNQLSRWKFSCLDHFLTIGILLGNFPSSEVESGVKRKRFRTVVDWVGHWIGDRSICSVAPVLPTNGVKLQSTADQPKLGSVRAKRKVLNWVIPAFSRGGGGHTTIFRAARTFARKGWKSVFWVTGTQDPAKIDTLYSEFIGYFPQSPIVFRSFEDGFDQVANEVILASAWDTAYRTLENRNDNARIYFVQDKESLFLPAGTNSMLADWSYDLGLDFICAGPWLDSMVSGKGKRHTFFELCASPIYSAIDPTLSERDILAAVYVRSHSPRRASDLMIEAANQLADLGLGEVVIFGDDAPQFDVSPNVTVAGILTADAMADLFHRSRFGLVASATNYSILPVELAASGTIVLQPSSASTAATTDARGACSVPPSAKEIVRFVVEHAGMDQFEFESLRAEYMEFARGLSWEDEFEKVEKWLSDNFLVKDAADGLDKKSVGILIPTYYPDERLFDIVKAIKSQLTSFHPEILILDSVLNGKPSEIVNEVGQDPDIRVERIDSADFSHGPSRTLAARMLKSDYYALLTQDAIPSNQYWLEALITPLEIIATCGYVFGRHRAYPEHHKLYGIELERHFDGLAKQSIVINRNQILSIGSDPMKLANYSFCSDNSAAYRGDLLRELGFPPVPFAEDQAMAKQLLTIGYSGVFANSSIVTHSHDYTSDSLESHRRGVEEGEALYQNFGLIRYRSPKQVMEAKAATYQQVVRDGVAAGLSKEDLKMFLAAKFAYIDGAWEASQGKIVEGREYNGF